MKKSIETLKGNVVNAIARDLKVHNTASGYNALKLLLTAFNYYQETERDGAEYIFNINDMDDLKCCVESGMTAKEIGELYLGSQRQHTEYFFFGFDEEIVPIANLSSLEFIILGNLEDVVEKVITYPFLSPYKEVYIRYVTSPIVDNTI